MTKILHVITDSRWGGAQQVCLNIAKASSTKGYDSFVACPPGGKLVDKIEATSVSYVPIKNMQREISPTRDVLCIVEVTKYLLLQSRKFDIVHCHSTKAGVIGRIASYIARIPNILFTVHGWGFYSQEISSLTRSTIVCLEKSLSNLTDKIICVSNYDKIFANKLGISDAENITVIHNGVNVEKFNKHKGNIKKMSNDGVKISFIGRLVDQKKPMEFLRLHKCLNSNGVYPTSVMAGKGPLKNECKRFISEHGLENVSMVGHIDDIPSLLRDTDIVVMTSEWESLPLVLIEAMSSGVPVVAYNVGGVNEIVNHGRTGYVARYGDLSSLSKYVYKLVQDNQLYREMARNAMSEARKLFSFDKMSKSYLSVYDSLS
jgi:glycosyltransferase involved in cell wall biosynthesis